VQQTEVSFFFFKKKLNLMREKDYGRGSFPFLIQMEERVGDHIEMLSKIRREVAYLAKTSA
jgi:hypothetical protein